MRHLVALALALAATGCSYVKPALDPSTNEGAWAEARDAATRKAKLYDILDDVAFATATWQSDAVRTARVDRMAVWKGMLPAEKEAALAKERAEAAEGEEFLLAFFSDERKANDLATDRGTWRVSLLVNGREEAVASKITTVKRDPAVLVLYPYITDFDTIYRVRFPRYTGAKPLAQVPFRLRIAGVLGALEMNWEPKGP